VNPTPVAKDGRRVDCLIFLLSDHTIDVFLSQLCYALYSCNDYLGNTACWQTWWPILSEQFSA
jgi:hypothetical protein